MSSQTPTTQCLGTQVGRYASSSAGLVALGGCNQNCQFGPSSSTTQCGTSLGVPTWCCYKPVFYWSAAQALAAPVTGVTAYPYISVPVTVRTLPQTVCIVSQCARVLTVGRAHALYSPELVQQCLPDVAGLCLDRGRHWLWLRRLQL